MGDWKHASTPVRGTTHCRSCGILRPFFAHNLKHNGRHLQLDETPSWCSVDSITSQVLDALAAICVPEPDSAFAVTHEVEGLLVASNLAAGVPDNIVRRLEHVWSQMRLLAGDPRSKFIVELYSFAWPALHQRLASKAPVITQALDSMTMYNGNGSRAGLSEDVTATFNSIRALVETVRATVLDNHNDEVPSIVTVHDTSVALHKLLAGKDVLSALESFCEFAPGTPNIAAEIYSIVWLSSAVECLFAFGSPAQFTSLANLDFRVVPIPSCSRPTLVNADIPQLRKQAAESYIDSMMSNPEPNFDADFTSAVLQPLRRCLEPVNVRDVTAHAESVLLAHIELRGSESIHKGPPYCQYIGTSEPSCLPCFRLFEAHT
ncbi:hypothetical protein EXIGLDRAFT_836636 [Exidia glandulosa HHB12029]|uniref:Uncharacterized protein n=1 Tax=Exidia glandulosa HHB12029 TaxID=1314781 RepID=A0A165HLP7_EXIGL|nr:hypothetical protein EXIGLDRAFT_836636 [Exidia glandulosa HHB12029]